MCHISYTAARCVHCGATQFRREQGRVQCEDVRKGRRYQGQTSATSYSEIVCADCFQDQAVNDDTFYTTTKSKKK